MIIGSVGRWSVGKDYSRKLFWVVLAVNAADVTGNISPLVMSSSKASCEIYGQGCENHTNLRAFKILFDIANSRLLKPQLF